MAELAPGTVLGERFEILGELGSGGMATVYLARDRVRDGRVALKLLHPHLAADPAMRGRLRREVEASAHLKHPGALTAFDLHELDGRLALSMPYHPGQTLEDHLRMHGPLPADQVTRLGLRLAEVLAEAHRAGILHRDLSGRNVMLDERGGPMLTDFGLAHVGQPGVSAKSTRVLGTPGFVGAEVLRGQRADPRSDLYGLGAVLYLAATGKAPFAELAPMAALEAQLSAPAPDPRLLRPELPAPLAETIIRLLDPDPSRRPAGAEALRSALERGEIPTTPEPPVAAAPPTPGSLSLPDGEWTVVVRESSAPTDRMRRRMARAHARVEAPNLETTVALFGRSALGAVQTAMGLPTADALAAERRLCAAVAEASGNPTPEVPRAMLARRFRIVHGVPRDLAARLAAAAREEGFAASVVRARSKDAPLAFLLQRWWVLIPLIWILIPALMETFHLPGQTTLLAVALTILLPTVVRPWVEQRYGSARIDGLPIAFPRQMTPAATPVRQSESSPQPDALGGRAAAELDALEAGIAAAGLPDAAVADLAQGMRGLRTQATALSQKIALLEAEIARSSASDPAEADWARRRLERMETLARAGDPVDPTERARLAAALAAWEARETELAQLESAHTAAVAGLLEIAATAGRARRSLLEEPEPARSIPRLRDALEQQAKAAARARRELA